jgi:hypothetical protein
LSLHRRHQIRGQGITEKWPNIMKQKDVYEKMSQVEKQKLVLCEKSSDLMDGSYCHFIMSFVP